MNSLNQALQKYIASHSSPEDPILAELDRLTHLKVLNPRMVSGHFQGKLLELFSRMISPESILEIGTYTGYSAICLAKGLSEQGKLITIEKNDEIISFAGKFIEKAGLTDKVEIISGDALDILPGLKSSFDLVFIDADKKEYAQYYDLIFEKVKKGGYIIADNVLWNGKVVEKTPPTDKETMGIKVFNEKILNDLRVEVLILPFRDGLSIIRKLL
jgi:caffeoyl-CoA O-methyltransferase